MGRQSTHLENGWLRPHKPTKEEVANLLEIVERDLKDTSAKGFSDDWKFGIAYNATLKLCSVFSIAQATAPRKIWRIIELCNPFLSF